MTRFRASKSLKIFGVDPVDPGYLYVIENGGNLKIGRSVNPKKRLREAKTWIPDAEVIGIKPFWNHRFLEMFLHIGLATFWKTNEWYDFGQDDFLEHFLDDFHAFSDYDINRNSVDFIYMMNGTGMAELTLEHSQHQSSKACFLRKHSQDEKYR